MSLEDNVVLALMGASRAPDGAAANSGGKFGGFGAIKGQRRGGFFQARKNG